ncbi:MAG: ribosome silencing factor [Gammaproteobacteria bacterium]|jgi:ribosome-associated protein|nr:ribosome silencing factor [Gammaproteobacteria bacterium]MBT4494160.1 ribosome silencing factor [Gammaproteobacteria bacterium]MBT7370440.1 ribosome silencing factor [Gammaproteobacteria bacterium]
MESEALKDLVVDALEDIKGIEIVVLDVEAKTDIADYMVVASGTTSRQVKALADNVQQEAKAAGNKVVGVEGGDTAEWVLIDLGDVIVHVMLPKVRDFYDLERLWSLGPKRNEDTIAED